MVSLQYVFSLLAGIFPKMESVCRLANCTHVIMVGEGCVLHKTSNTIGGILILCHIDYLSTSKWHDTWQVPRYVLDQEVLNCTSGRSTSAASKTKVRIHFWQHKYILQVFVTNIIGPNNSKYTSYVIWKTVSSSLEDTQVIHQENGDQGGSLYTLWATFIRTIWFDEVLFHSRANETDTDNTDQMSWPCDDSIITTVITAHGCCG